MVLIVDDDEDLRESVRDLLHRRGYDVGTAADGRAALEILRAAERVCIVLLDLVMPIMDGWRFIEAVRRQSSLASVPIVIVSGHAATHAPEGVAGIVRKPIDLSELFAIVERHCGPASPSP
jgi:CheY-like chemotaxis protein